ncbi:hypothetical protein ABMA27_013027, partial [Loxostege sticticalis]
MGPQTAHHPHRSVPPRVRDGLRARHGPRGGPGSAPPGAPPAHAGGTPALAVGGRRGRHARSRV